MEQKESVNTESRNTQDDVSQCGLRKSDIDRMNFDVFTRRNKKKTNYGFRLAKFFSNGR